MCQSLDQIANCWDNRMRNDILYFPCFLLIRLRGWSEQEIQKNHTLTHEKNCNHQMSRRFLFQVKITHF